MKGSLRRLEPYSVIYYLAIKHLLVFRQTSTEVFRMMMRTMHILTNFLNNSLNLLKNQIVLIQLDYNKRTKIKIQKVHIC
jgi:hypothetical protein